MRSTKTTFQVGFNIWKGIRPAAGEINTIIKTFSRTKILRVSLNYDE